MRSTFFSWKCVRTANSSKKKMLSHRLPLTNARGQWKRTSEKLDAKSERQDAIAKNYVSLWIAISPEREMISTWNKKHFKGEGFLLHETSVISRFNYVLGIERRLKNKFKWVYEKFEMNQFWSNSMKSMN